MNPQHRCGETLYTPKIYFRKSGELVSEKIGHWWCRKCKCRVKIAAGEQEDLKEDFS